MPRMVYLFEAKFPLWGEMRYAKLKQWFNNPSNTETHVWDEYDEINLPGGGILWYGELVELADDPEERHSQAKRNFKLQHGKTQKLD